MTIGSFQVAGAIRPAATEPRPVTTAVSLPANINSAEEAKIRAAMAKLSPEDRKLAEAQVFCAIDQDSPLGSMGPVLKVMAKGQPVFVCCKGCESEVRTNPDQALAMLEKLMNRTKASKK